MNKKALEVLWFEMASHLQAALTAIETAMLTGSVEQLPVARAEVAQAWQAFDAAVAPVLDAAGGHHAPPR